MQFRYAIKMLSISVLLAFPASAAELDRKEATEIAKEAYIYGVPMVSDYATIYAFSINAKSPEYKGPFNSVLNVARVFTPEDKGFVTPNSDTPYTFMGLDLRSEPMVITVPKMEKNRYFVFQLMDLYTFNFDYIGTRTTGNDGGTYMIAGPKWKGEDPKGVTKVIRSETEFVNVIGRTQLFNSDDLENVKKIQAGYKLQSLSEYQGTDRIPEPSTEWVQPIRPAEQKTNPEFFNVLAFLLQFTPTHPSETELRARFEKLGLKPGKHISVISCNLPRRRSGIGGAILIGWHLLVLALQPGSKNCRAYRRRRWRLGPRGSARPRCRLATGGYLSVPGFFGQDTSPTLRALSGGTETMISAKFGARARSPVNISPGTVDSLRVVAISMPTL